MVERRGSTLKCAGEYITTFFNFKKLRVLTTECIYIFRMVRTLKRHYFLNAINRLVFVMETQCFYCEVGTKFMYITLIKFSFYMYNL
jgi:hypothetical protein